VMKGDLVHFGAKIDDNTLKHTIPEQMKRILSKSIASVDDCMFACCTGDEIHVVTKTPISICGIGTAILDHLKGVKGAPMIRLAVDSGPESFDTDNAPTTGLPLRTVARIEPKIRPGERWCTDSFRSALERASACQPSGSVYGFRGLVPRRRRAFRHWEKR